MMLTDFSGYAMVCIYRTLTNLWDMRYVSTDHLIVPIEIAKAHLEFDRFIIFFR